MNHYADMPNDCHNSFNKSSFYNVYYLYDEYQEDKRDAHFFLKNVASYHFIHS
jgi:hypothetical protein